MKRSTDKSTSDSTSESINELIDKLTDKSGDHKHKKARHLENQQIHNLELDVNGILDVNGTIEGYNFDLMYSNEMADRFIQFYDPDATEYDSGFSSESDEDISLYYNHRDVTLKKLLVNVIENELWKCTSSSENHVIRSCNQTYTIGDMVDITYLPNSQKYIYHYNDQAFRGILLYVDTETSNGFLFAKKTQSLSSDIKKKILYDVRTIERLGCHFFGMAPGYSYFIEMSEHQ
jgi:hypothetical protein